MLSVLDPMMLMTVLMNGDPKLLVLVPPCRVATYV
jgi:hypothetical protein